MTKILTSKGEELSRVLGEVLQNEVLGHIWESTDARYIKWCSRCGFYNNELTDTSICEMTTPIPLDWHNAMRWRDWAVEKFGMSEYLVSIKAIRLPYDRRGYSYTDLWSIYAKPEHYLKAAALCVERNNK